LDTAIFCANTPNKFRLTLGIREVSYLKLLYAWRHIE